MVDASPPPFFKRGLSPAARLAILLPLSVLLLVLDGRTGAMAPVRQALAVLVNPLQHAVNAPVLLAVRVGEFFVAHEALRRENEALREKLLAQAAQTLANEGLVAENARLRALLGAKARLAGEAMVAEILYGERDPFSRRIVIDKGALAGVRPGSPVTDDIGLIGQVTRVYAMASEVTLITDRDQMVPVQSVRNGLRAVVFGNGQDGTLTIPFMPLSADIQPGDRFVTSGIDGIYPPGLPVAVVSKVERSAALPFARVSCLPTAGPQRYRQVLVLTAAEPSGPTPPREIAPSQKHHGRR